MNVTVTAGEAYDTDLLAQSLEPRPGDDQGGNYGDLQASGEYRLARHNVEFAATGASALRYYGSVGELRSVSHTVGAGVDGRVASRTSLMVNGTAAYSPSYLYGLFPTFTEPSAGTAIPPAPNYTAYDESSYSLRATARLTQSLSARDELAITVNGSYTDYVEGSGNALANARRDLANAGADAVYSRSLSRRKTVLITFHHAEGRFGYATGGRSVEYGLTAGMQIKRALSATRNVTFAFDAGSIAVENPVAASLSIPGGRAFLATADVSASYDFGRTWQARGAYRRGQEYIAALRAPVFTDGVTIETSGFLTRRTEFRASAAYSNGAPTLGRGVADYTTSTAAVRIQRTLTRSATLYGEYFYYFYDFGTALLVQTGLSTALERHGVRAGVMLSLHALGR